MLLPIVINTCVFIFLSAIHFYWAFDGKWGVGGVVPVNAEGRQMLDPGKFGTIIVALGLLAFALVTVGNTGVFDALVGRSVIIWATRGIALLFTLRAIGDFTYVGFFKKIKNTTFARNDTRIFSPLCVLIAVLSIMASMA
ncbi:DUF3995 domain-containing protein [Chitinophaga flava]|nr:DUF3995 domain-containing protein [Chitinophaga flava]